MSAVICDKKTKIIHLCVNMENPCSRDHHHDFLPLPQDIVPIRSKWINILIQIINSETAETEVQDQLTRVEKGLNVIKVTSRNA